jgi:hypothetical protein
MKASKITAAAILALFASSAMAFDGGEGRGGRRRGFGGGFGGRGDNERAFMWWSCRADARDGSGLFFYGMGRDQASAYVQALETCSRAQRSCMITCSIDNMI